MSAPDLTRNDIKGVVFSSGKNKHIAEALVQRLNDRFPNHPWEHWTNIFSDQLPILNEFLKRLLVIDAAVLLLTDDDLASIRPYSEATGRGSESYQQMVPRDNVIFEVGAIMSRIGMKRTFIAAPDLKKEDFRILDYLDHFKLIRYAPEKGAGANWPALMGVVAEEVIKRLGKIGEDIYHSDLPALGLCYGYFYNFINPVLLCLKDPQHLELADKSYFAWEPKNGYTLTLAIPHELMGTRDAKKHLGETLQLASTSLKFKDGRNPGVFILKPEPGDPLHVVDIPTTLFTSKSVIDRVDRYWSEQDDHALDNAFVKQLADREILAFRRQLEALIQGPPALQHIHIIDITELPAHLKRLQGG